MKILKIIADVISINPDDVDIYDDISNICDELDIIEIVMELERTLNIEIMDSEIIKFKTIANIIDAASMADKGD